MPNLLNKYEKETGILCNQSNDLICIHTIPTTVHPAMHSRIFSGCSCQRPKTVLSPLNIKKRNPLIDKEFRSCGA